MRQLFILLIVFSFFACKNDTGSSNNLSNVPDAAPVDPATLTIPSTCSLISAAEVKDILGTKTDVNLKDATDPTNKFSKSCFFRWDDADTPNAGIMIQIQTNSVYSEYPEYISNYIKSKLESGEMAMGNDVPFKFSKFDAAGRPGAYSFEQARFYWTLDNNYVCTLFFNVSTLNEKKMVKAAEKIIEKVNSNFAKATK